MLLAFVALMGWVDLLFVSDWLSVRDVQVKGLKQLESAEIAKATFVILEERGVWRPWPARHGWFIDKERVARELQKRFFAEKVTVDKINNNVLRLKIEERAKRIIIRSQHQYLWMDINGFVTSELNFEERQNIQSRLLGQRSLSIDDIPIVHLNDAQELHVSEIAASENDVRKWIQSASQITKEGFLYREMVPPDHPSGTTATFVSQEGYKVYLDLAEPLQAQVRSYLAFLRSRRTNAKISEYVDARIPGKVYVK